MKIGKCDTNYMSKKPHICRTIFKTNGKGLRVSIIKRDSLKIPLVLRIENVSSKHSYMYGLTRRQVKRLIRTLNEL
jgi:hypothetical protein